MTVFETRLTVSIRALNFSKLLESENVKRVVEEADGYQPHLVAPEMGYRRLLQECLILFKVAPPPCSRTYHLPYLATTLGYIYGRQPVSACQVSDCPAG